MKIWDAIKKGFVPQRYTGGTLGYSYPLLGGTRFNFIDDNGDLWTNSTVSTCINVKAGMKAQLKLILEQWDDKTQTWVRTANRGMEASAIAPFLKPNDYYGFSDLLLAIQLSYDCRGHSFIVKRRNKLNQVVGFWYVPHFAVEMFSESPEQLVTYYRYMTPGGAYQRLEYPEVVMNRQGIDPRDMRCGLSPLAAQVRNVNVGNNAQNRAAALMINGFDGTVVSPKSVDENSPSPENLKMVADKLNQSIRDRVGMASFVPFVADIQKIGHAPKDMDFSGVAGLARDEICAAMGADPMAFGLPSSSKTYSNLEEAMDALGSVVLAECRVWADQWGAALFPEMGIDSKVFRYGWDTSNVDWLKDDTDQLHERVRADFESGLIDLYTAQTMIGMKPDMATKGVTYFDLQAKKLQPTEATDQKKSLVETMALKNLERLRSLGRAPETMTKAVKANPKQAQHDAIISRMENEFDDAMNDYAKGRISLTKLQERLTVAIEEGHRDAYRLGVLSAGGTIDDQIVEQYVRQIADIEGNFLLGYLQDIEDGRYNDDENQFDPAKVLSRSALYASKVSGSASWGFVDSSDDGEEYEWQLSSSEHCEDCKYLASISPYDKSTLGRTPRDGNTVCLGNCKCRLVRVSDAQEIFGPVS